MDNDNLNSEDTTYNIYGWRRQRNPGKGLSVVVMEWVGKPYKKGTITGFRLSTNNRMELLAVIVGLEN
jgi:ribonuclease HI